MKHLSTVVGGGLMTFSGAKTILSYVGPAVALLASITGVVIGAPKLKKA